MKSLYYSIILFFTLFLLAKCGTKATFMAKPLEATHLQGHWVRNDYLSLLEVTKSPFLARAGAEGVTAMRFDVSKVEGDSLEVEFNFNNHEGGTFFLYLNKNIENQKSYVLGLSSSTEGVAAYGLQLEYEKDTTLLLIQYDAAKKPSAVFRYTCVSRTNNLPVDAVHYALNQRLLEGTYQIEDTKQKVTLSRGGTVKNWANYAQYLANTDFVLSNTLSEDIIDIISFYRKEADFSGATDFGFKLSGDTLRLYDVELAEDQITYLRKGIKHVLTKVK